LLDTTQPEHGLGLLIAYHPVIHAFKCQKIVMRTQSASRFEQPAKTREALLRQGAALMQSNKFEDAAHWYALALDDFPDDAQLHYCKGVAHHQEHQYLKAIDCYCAALQIKIDFADAFENLSDAQAKMHMFDDAFLSISAAIALRPNKAMSHARQAQVLVQQEKFDLAIQAATQAIKLDPQATTAYMARSNAHRGLVQIEQSMADLRAAMAINPANADYEYNLAFDLLLNGDFEEGWARYEKRFQTDNFLKHPTVPMHQPLWDGVQDISGQTLLICPEQGLGDQIQFARYALLLQQRGVQVVLSVEPSLIQLLSSMHPDIRVVSSRQTVDTLPAHDCYITLMSLPRLFKTQLNTIPACPAYLKANRDIAQHWQSRVTRGQRPQVGISWSGSTTHINDHNRSMTLDALAPLLGLDIDFHILQTDIRPYDEARLRLWPNLHDWRPALTSFNETAGLADQLDLVISVDTSVAHLTSALGKPTWVMLPYAPDFRWLLQRHDSPWYPSATLFRQHEAKAWGPVVDEIVHALQQRFSA
jgi:tetratricopeptide (TPR) repeat protein